MGLKDNRTTRTNTNTGGGSSNLGGAAVEVIKYEKDDGEPVIRGKLVSDSLGMDAGQEITLRLSKDTAERITDSLKKGMGTGAGSILIVENVTADFKNEGDFIARWITTAVSAAKKLDESTGHDRREVVKAMVTAPVISFRNPSSSNDEPEYIMFGLTNESVSLRGRDGKYVTYDREFLMDRLGAVDDVSKVRVQSLAIAPDGSVLCDSVEDCVDKIKAIVSNNNGAALVRATDEEGEVEFVTLRKKWDLSADDFAKNLLETGIFRNVPNEAIANMLASGELKLEVIEGTDIPFLGDSRKRIVSDVIKNKELQGMNITYGKNSSTQATPAVFAISPTSDNAGYFFCHDPVRVQGERSSLRYIKTPHFNLTEPTETKANEAQKEAPQAGDQGEDDSENFGAGNFEFDTPNESEMQEHVSNRTSASRRNN